MLIIRLNSMKTLLTEAAINFYGSKMPLNFSLIELSITFIWILFTWEFSTPEY